ncbi:TlpA disulfide reductase family protein [Flagellimonas sp.]|uniref:TlpA disulfide reductase family protein n=1 Tax=Flagellimonas sp. TaxID=2058762 RepID=UPI003B52CD9B
MKHLLCSSVFLVLLISGCGNKAKTDTSMSSKEEDKVEVRAQNDEKVKFPVYDFTEFEPLLHKDDGKTYVVNFWATWCKPCLEEMPYFEKVNAERKADGVEVILVSLDMPSMWKSRLEPYVEKKGIKSEVVILDDPKQNDWIPKIDSDWDGGIPATIIYNGDQRKFYGHGFTYDELTEAVNGFTK